jgi:exodeoxyribonuclease VII large subunit
MKIGVATSPTGAAIRDIFSTLGRRFPSLTIYFRPAIVQGAEAAEDIVAAINELCKTDAELLIIGRGGGSIEDLWAFNMEIVADAIFNCKIPVISAVGHETDFTIADFVADIRAATPTAAAEFSTPVTLDELLMFLSQAKEDMNSSIKEIIEDKYELLNEFSGAPLQNRIIQRLRNGGQLLDQMEYRIRQGSDYRFRSLKDKITGLEKMMRANYPLSPLKKGFALLKHNHIVIPNSVSLSGLKNVDIIRENESVNVKVNRINPKELFDVSQF